MIILNTRVLKPGISNRELENGIIATPIIMPPPPHHKPPHHNTTTILGLQTLRYTERVDFFENF